MSGIPTVLTHVKALGPHVWGFGQAIVRRVERAREEGVQVFADQYPYTASATGLDAALLPRWSQAGGRDSLNVRMARPADMARIREAMVDNLERRGGADRIQFRRYRPLVQHVVPGQEFSADAGRPKLLFRRRAVDYVQHVLPTLFFMLTSSHRSAQRNHLLSELVCRDP